MALCSRDSPQHVQTYYFTFQCRYIHLYLHIRRDTLLLMSLIQLWCCVRRRRSQAARAARRAATVARRLSPVARRQFRLSPRHDARNLSHDLSPHARCWCEDLRWRTVSGGNYKWKRVLRHGVIRLTLDYINMFYYANSTIIALSMREIAISSQ